MNSYICQKKEKIEIFEINPNIITGKDITVKSGKEFCIKITTFIKPYALLNKNENKDLIPLIKTDSIAEHYEGEDFGGRKGYSIYLLNFHLFQYFFFFINIIINCEFLKRVNY